MTRSFWKCWAAAVFFGLACGQAATIAAEDTATIDLEEISRQLTDWRASFVNVHLVWELRSLEESEKAVVEWSPAPDPEAGSLFCRQEWIWADHGLDLFEQWAFFYDDGGCKAHFVEVFNGPKGVVFRAHYRTPKQGAPEEFADLLLRGLGTGKPTASLDRVPLKGLYWSSVAAWLPEMLSRWKWKLEGIEDVGGDSCARVVGTPPDDVDSEFISIFWLDLNHNCLVRRYRSPQVPQRRTGSDFIVDEYQQLASGVWFPKRGRIQFGGKRHENQVFVVTMAAVNESLDLARFEPPAPAAGTIVDDGKGRKYRHGVAGASGARKPQASAAGEPSLASVEAGSTPRRYSAARRPSTWPWWSAGLVSLSVLLLALGFLISHRKKENRS